MTGVPIEQATVVELVADQLRDRILDEHLAPGSAVTELEIASYYSVSRPTAKGAITLLVSEGLLRPPKRTKSAIVPLLTSADVRDLFKVRIPLELEALRFVILSGDIPTGLTQAVEDVRAMDRALPSKFVEADLRFHRLLVGSANAQRLYRFYRMIQGEIHLSMVQSQKVLGAERVSHEHGQILDAIRAEDLALATKIMRDHLEDACHDIARDLDLAQGHQPAYAQ